MTRSAEIESLETRTLLSGTPLGVDEVAYLGGTQLRLQGTAAADAISVTRTAEGLLVSNADDWSHVFTTNYNSLRIDGAAGSDVIALDPALEIDAFLYGGTGNDTLTGGAGDDRLYGGQGTNELFGGDGDDVLVTIGGGADDSLTGNGGRDSYWSDAASKEVITDVSAEETDAGAVHRVGSFYAASNEPEKTSPAPVSARTASVDARRSPESILEARLARAAARAARAEARAAARAERLEAKAEARAERLEAKAAARAERIEARAARRAARLEAKEVARGTRSATFEANLAEPAPGPMDLLGQDLADPVIAFSLVSTGVKYETFSDRPLFGADGPSPDDITQGAVGDCYYIAVLSSVAKIDPTRIRESVVDLGDGTYCVQFNRGGEKVFVRVDGELAAYSESSKPAYAALGEGGAMWVAVMEKAYAFFRTGAGTYDSLASGWMNETYSALGTFSMSTYAASGATALLQLMSKELNGGKSVTFGVAVPEATSGLVAYHAYSVDAVVTNVNNVPTHVRLRNPWGFDGLTSSDGNGRDGYVTLTAQQAFASFLGFTSASV